MNNAFAHLFKEAVVATTAGSKIEVNKYVGPVSTFMRVLTSKDGDFSSNFDKNIEGKIRDTTMNEKLFDNHTIQANKGKTYGQLVLQNLFGLCNTYKKVKKT